MLPERFLERMSSLLTPEEYKNFVDSFDRVRYKALRLNPLKLRNADKSYAAAVEELSKLWSLKQVPWSPMGQYYGPEDQPGKHIYHEAGLYYIQEPSAMSPAAYLGAKPGEKILDLCSAPGGKGTQIAGDMMGEGLLVLNEIHPARAKILSENVERMGIANAIVVNESPDSLADRFREEFDRIMVDAPCSGEGMFLKNEEALTEWSEENVALCAERQDTILDAAAAMLKPGGRIVYSTCTFAPAENEGTISRFIHSHPEFHVAEVPLCEGMSHGRPEWVEKPCDGIEKTIRLFPHLLEGEGHYLAVLEKDGEIADDADMASDAGSRGGKNSKKAANRFQTSISEKECKDYIDFRKDTLAKDGPMGKLLWGGDGILILFGEQLYLAPAECPNLKGLKVLRPGLHLGTMKKNRFEPSHALALALGERDVANVYDGTEIAEQYIKGMAFPAEGKRGWNLITANGYSIGWGKLADGTMKNHYPKGLRK